LQKSETENSDRKKNFQKISTRSAAKVYENFAPRFCPIMTSLRNPFRRNSFQPPLDGLTRRGKLAADKPGRTQGPSSSRRR